MADRGIDFVLNRNTAAFGVGYATAVWNAVGNVADLDVPEEKDTDEISVRRGKGAKMYAVTMLDLAITGKMLCPPVGAAAGNLDFDDYTVFNNAWMTNGILDLLVLDDLTTVIGASGFRGVFCLSKWSQPQGNSDRKWRNFELKVSDWDVATYAATPTAEVLRKALVGTGPAVTYASLGSSTFA